MRRGIFGGSFDPIHNAHLALAECCAAQLSLDRVILVPAACQPLKPTGPKASDRHRVEMLKRAAHGKSLLEVCELEIERGGVSYTVDTLRALKREHPEDDLYFLMGADSLADIAQWRNPEEICQLATLAVVRRADQEPDFRVLEPYVSSQRLEEITAAQVEMPEISVSSSAIRRRIQDDGHGDAKTGWPDDVPEGVAEYIRKHNLYAE